MKVLSYASGASTWMGSVGLVALALLIMSDIIVRAATGRSVPGVIEYTEVLLVIVAYLGIVRAQATNSHVGIAVVHDRMPVRAAWIIRSLAVLAAQLVLLWMVWKTGVRAYESFLSGEVRHGLARVALWPARVAIPVGLLLWSAMLVTKLRRAADRQPAANEGAL